MIDALRAAHGLRGVLLAARMDTEAARCLPAPVAECLIATGLCRLAVPASLGGYEANPLLALQVYEELAAAEASVAWIAWNNQLNCLTSRHLADEPRNELFGDPRVLFANSTRPSGRGIAVEDGLRMSGRWSLVSGCQLAEWIALMCVITDGTEPRMVAPGMPETRMAYVRKGSYCIVDTWHVGGLRGTGSHDVVVDNVFVPAEHTFALSDASRIERPLFRMPFRATMAAGCAAITIGIAQAALDAALELASTKREVGPGPGLVDRPATQASIGAAAAAIEAARLVVHDTLRDVWSACQRGKPPTDFQQARVLGACVHAARTAKEVVTAMYEVAGTSALYVDCRLERAHRDVHAVAQHVILAHKQLEDAGRVRLGLPPSTPLH